MKPKIVIVGTSGIPIDDFAKALTGIAKAATKLPIHEIKQYRYKCPDIKLIKEPAYRNENWFRDLEYRKRRKKQ